MKKRKKIIIAAAVLAALAAAAAITVFAYLQSTVDQPNKFKIGKDEVEVTESFTEPVTMGMDNTFEKVVSVKNSGASDQFVRVYLDFSDSRVRDKSQIVYSNGTKAKSWEAFLMDLPSGWTYVPNDATGTNENLRGYFYYTKVLKPGETTPALIEGVRTNFTDPSDPANTDNITDFDVIVYTESVQTTELDADGTVYSNGDWDKAWNSFLILTQPTAAP